MIHLVSKENRIRILYGVSIKYNMYVLQLGSDLNFLADDSAPSAPSL